MCIVMHFCIAAAFAVVLLAMRCSDAFDNSRIGNSCSLNCTRYYTFICIAPHLFSHELLDTLRLFTSSRSWPIASISIVILECEQKEDWASLAELSRKIWSQPDCKLDIMLLLVFHNFKLIPSVSIHPDSHAHVGRLLQQAGEAAFCYALDDVIEPA
uniref:Glyco_transf_7N domain-containing protein n=1 Tax=Ascaris lumbricoides TaxID=6252 RepID=A0A0M3HYY6_ASCLU